MILLGYQGSRALEAGKGSVFAIEIALPPQGLRSPHVVEQVLVPSRSSARRRGQCLRYPRCRGRHDLLELLSVLLTAEGHRVTSASDGNVALELLRKGGVRPNLVIADFNLPKWHGWTAIRRTAPQLDGPWGAGAHSHRRYLDRNASRDRPERLRSPQQADKVENTASRHRNVAVRAVDRRSGARGLPSRAGRRAIG